MMLNPWAIPLCAFFLALAHYFEFTTLLYSNFPPPTQLAEQAEEGFFASYSSSTLLLNVSYPQG